ncbi:hypothetical protein EPI10_007960 [Gossypium australe]|uniref:Uncharacterized protein n=1 Tax=Gossypium australe TaxID=47621 RepID=A0A5B6V3M0_9ROSI|nr:hypothetical protein EPI10_007960 [Gossypium australe]
MMKGKEKVSNESAAKPSGVSITQSPALPSLPPRNRSDTIPRRFGDNESQWSSDDEEDVYADDNNQQMEAICWCLSLDGYEDQQRA